MNIKVLGTGCAKCHKLEEVVMQVVRELGINDPVQMVGKMKEIMEYPILMTPGLVINDELVVSGKVPDKAEVTRYFSNALAQE